MKQIFILTILLTNLVAVHSQTGFRNEGNLQIHSGASLFVSMPATNSSSASLVNNGDLYIAGNLVNDQASMTAGTGTLYLDGSSSQSLSGSQPFKTYNLFTDNASGITLNNDLSVAGVHTFTAGLIHSSGTPNYLIYESGSSYSGSNDSRHVTGWVKKNGNTGFTFPVGDNAYLRPTAISSLSAVSTFNCHYYTPTPNITNVLAPVVLVKGNEYWQLDRVSGGTASVTLNWDHSKVAMDNIVMTEIHAGYYTGGMWTNAGGSASGNVTTTGTVTSGTMSSFGTVTLAYTAFPIPVKLIAFTGWRRSGVTNLHWVAENESDLSHYTVERSFDGLSFISIGRVNARNSGLREVYGFDDAAAFTGKAYYRLKNTDIDGQYEYSNIITVTEKGLAGPAFIVVNPVQSAITVFRSAAPAGMYNYQLFNSGGQLIQKGIINFNNTNGSLVQLPAAISKGIYTLELVNGQSSFTDKLLIR